MNNHPKLSVIQQKLKCAFHLYKMNKAAEQKNARTTTKKKETGNIIKL